MQVSRLYLPYISPTSPLYLLYISPTSPPSLPYLSSALVQTWAEVGPLPYAWHVWRTASVMKVVPRMIGMCLGWALGNAFKATFLQIDTHARGTIIECSNPWCNWWLMIPSLSLSLTL